MARRYGEPVAVEAVGGRPAAFTWRGRRRAVVVIGDWRLVARWWDSRWATNRTYYRVQTRDWQVFELYHDAATGAWVLDVCQD
jgi:hypothetical protein